MSDDPRLNTLITPGTSGFLVLLGYPFQHASIRMRKKGGQENGPCCLRRFYSKIGPLINPEYQTDISHLHVTDYGNIVGDPKNPVELQEELQKVVTGLLEERKVPIVFGGSRETTVGTTRSFYEKYPEGRFLYFLGYPSVSRPYDNDKLSSNSLFQILPPVIHPLSLLIGTHEKYWPTASLQHLPRLDINHIRSHKLPEDPPEDIFEPRTQMGCLMKKLLEEEGKGREIYVSFSMEVVDGFKGTYYKSLEGLRMEEVLEVMLLLGRDERVGCLEMTEFNPAYEDYESSLKILNMVYYFLMGYSRREKKGEEKEEGDKAETEEKETDKQKQQRETQQNQTNN